MTVAVDPNDFLIQLLLDNVLYCDGHLVCFTCLCKRWMVTIVNTPGDSNMLLHFLTMACDINN